MSSKHYLSSSSHAYAVEDTRRLFAEFKVGELYCHQRRAELHGVSHSIMLVLANSGSSIKWYMLQEACVCRTYIICDADEGLQTYAELMRIHGFLLNTVRVSP